ncbi:MAG: TIGR02444 family protein [Rhodospirillaceae bacterium]|nr:TIGR02444 family protein [Rhodospirillaceae bacterium]
MNASTRSAVQSNPLWDFATWAYKEPGVEKACLALQGKHGIDVNILLFCLWLAHIGVGSSNLSRYLAGSLKLSRDWQRNLVEPLRGVRDAMKDFIESSDMVGPNRVAASELRERVKACERDMEHLQMLALYALVQEPADARERSPAEKKDDANNNLTVYFSATGVKLDPLAQAQVMRILTAVFGA